MITDGRKEVGRGTDLEALRTRHAGKVSAKLTRSARGITATGRTQWDFGAIPATTELGPGVVGYPHVVDEGSTVGVQVAENPAKARRAHELGLRRLLVLVNPSPIRWVVSHMSNAEKLSLGASAYPSVPDLLADAWLKASHQLLLAVADDPATVRDPDTFRKVADAVRQDAAPRTQAVTKVAAQTLATRAEVERELQAFDPADPLRMDVTEQLGNLTFNLFISATPDPWYERLPVYLQGIALRLRTAPRNRGRDERTMGEVEQIESEYAALCDAQPPGPLPPEVEEIAFLIEELRVSLFAQGLRTAVPVSVKRVRQAMRRVPSA